MLEFIPILFVFVFVCLVIYFFVRLLNWIFKNDANINKPVVSGRSPNAEFQRFCEILNVFYANGDISAQSYDEIRSLLESRFGQLYVIPPRVGRNRPDVITGAPSDKTAPPIYAQNDLSIPTATLLVNEAPIVAAIADSGPSDVARVNESMELQPANSQAIGVGQYETAEPAPWAMPEPPPVKPRVAWSELLKGFMEERNIRWGELASGILIVGSAMGLVISLRNELRNTIPYFPALLFMLVSLAIHGAGAYTLKRWKLRSTSRGLLLIGLLIVPLNFLAGVLLSSYQGAQRPLADPMLWVAVAIGLAGFGWMSWASSKLLYRRGYWPIILAVMGAGIFILIVNRLNQAWVEDKRWLISIPLALLMFGLLLDLSIRLKRRRALTDKTVHRVYITTGIVTFSMFVGLAIYFFRDVQINQVIASIAPSLSIFLVSVLAAAFSLFDRSHSKTLRMHRLVSACLLSIAWICILALGSYSAYFPRELFGYGLVVGLSLLALALTRRTQWLAPVACAFLTVSLIVVVNVASNNWDWRPITGFGNFVKLMINGKSALCWLATGFLLAALSSIFKKRFEMTTGMPAADADSLVGDTRVFSGSAMYLYSATFVAIGSAIALVSGRLNGDSFFDATVSTSLISVFAVMLNCLALTQRFATKSLWFIPPLAVGTTILAAIEAFFGNRFLMEALGDWNSTWYHRLMLTASALAILFSLASVVARLKSMENRLDWDATRTQLFASASTLAVMIGFGTAIFLIDDSPVRGLTLTLLILFASAMVTACACRTVFGWLAEWSSLATAILITALGFGATNEFNWFKPNHLILQSHAIAAWSSIWLLARMTGYSAWFGNWSVAGRNIPVDLSVLVTTIVSFSLIVWTLIGSANSVFREIALLWVMTMDSEFEVKNIAIKLTVCLVVWLMVSLASMFYYRNAGMAQLAALLFIGLAVVQATWWDFDAASGTAIRWLVTLAGALISVLFWIPSSRINTVRNIWSGSSEDWFNASFRRQPILASLVFSVGLSLLIAMFAIGAFLLIGPEVVGGPLMQSWLGAMQKVPSYGFPIALILATFLSYAISQRKFEFALAGSFVLQFIVVFQLVLLFLSPHPKLASDWFLNIVQFVSIGMTLYGLVWYFNRDRIEGAAPRRLIQPSKWLPLHALLNTGLVMGLVGLILVHYFRFPDTSGGWINFAASPAGILAVILLLPLLKFVFPNAAQSSYYWPVTLLSTAAVAFLAANIDRWQTGLSWLPFRVILWGMLATTGLQVGWLVLARERVRNVSLIERRPNWFDITPAYFCGVLTASFAVRGILFDASQYWHYAYALLFLNIIYFVAGCWFRNGRAAFGCALLAILQSALFKAYNPNGWFAQDEMAWIHLGLISLVILSLAWLGWYLFLRNRLRHGPNRSFLLLPNLVSISSCAWLLLWSTSGVMFRQIRGVDLVTPEAIVLFLSTAVLLVLGCWNDRSAFYVTGRSLFTLALGNLIFDTLSKRDLFQPKFSIWLMILSVVVCFWGLRVRGGTWLMQLGKQVGIRRLASGLKNSIDWLPRYAFFVAIPIIGFSTSIVAAAMYDRSDRFLSAFTAPLLGFAFVCFANASHRIFFQYVSLGLFTFGAMLISWADVDQSGILAGNYPYLIRTFLVLGFAVFLFGVVFSRWIRQGDSWVQALRMCSLATATGALVCLIAIVTLELFPIDVQENIALNQSESIGIFVVGFGLAAGLIAIAVLPKHDPLALTMEGRKVYVYVAHFVVMLVLVHAILTIPWLIRWGLKDYWPYIAMAVAFGGVGLSEILKRRNLLVLSDPLANMMRILPIFVALASLGVQTKADSAMVMLLAGFVFVAFATTENSFWNGMAAVVFGNIALWLYYGKFPGLEFWSHPQIWVIPPAFCAMVIADKASSKFQRSEIKVIRYVALAVIYIGSTSEIFIYGLGEQLWPPMILAFLAVLGLLAGMMFKVRIYIFLSILFLLISVVAMVSHAHRQLGHVWPWWAFGITLGVTILVMFGLFEKRRNLDRKSENMLSP